MGGEIADLFPGFEARHVTGDGAEIFCRIKGNGPPLLLLHGYPQTHAMWHPVADALARDFTVVVADLRGYGASDAPEGDPAHARYSKRAMARDMVAVMAALGHARFAVAGHDRGGRVAYRMALDHPDRLTALCVLDILPTYEYWKAMDWRYAMAIYHWLFLAQPHPLPERLIAGDPGFYLDYTLASWTAAKDLSAFDARALAAYRASFSQAARQHAACEDYRAGATIDMEHDSADRAAGRRIATPTLVLYGNAGIAGKASTPLDTWKTWTEDLTGEGIDGGHFVVEENPQATLAALTRFLKARTGPAA
ncbi:MAG: alpha/beta hydrolase [Rhodobacteraceae bacterium]|nr:alpha/beta hydrolase [Paracoccaceae bacterium]